MRLLITSVILFIACFCCYPQEKEYQLPDVVVTAGRTPFSSYDLGRTLNIILPEEMRNSPVDNIQDLLQYISGVDIRQRGNEGVQGDISIRGGTSEQSLIMIDGMKISDPQTGHHNLNLPVNINEVERIEILKGQGSKSFGANAFSGVVNIITKKNTKSSLSLNLMGGENGLYSYGLGAVLPVANFNNRFSAVKRKSDGYRHNTAFNEVNFSYQSSLNMGSSSIDFFAGFNDKEFGANGFYPAAPNQWEHTTTTLTGLSSSINSGNFSLSPKIYWRRNKDRYLLNYIIPSLYENNHKTDVVGTEVQASLETGIGLSSLGIEFMKDKIVSSNLGNHSRETLGLFAEQTLKVIPDFVIVFGGFAYNYPELGWKFWPGLDITYHAGTKTKIYASAGKAFRIPTYTDLYYTGGGSQGNPLLKHEETINYEAGLRYFENEFFINTAVFRKDGKNIIDWFYNSEGNVWVANNIAAIITNGFELSFNYSFPQNFFISGLGLSYTYLDLEKELTNTISRYLLDHLRHQLIINIGNLLPFNVRQSWTVRFEDRINLEKHWIVDTKLYYNLDLAKLYVNITNLFNTPYKDFVNVPLPGRWISAGVDMNLNFGEVQE